MIAHTPAGLLAAALILDPARPLLTFYDDSTGERTELSAVTLNNWVSKTANLLVDGHGLGQGDTATVALPPHWQTAAVMLGCWTAGLAISHAAPSAVLDSSAQKASGPRTMGGATDIGFGALDRLGELDSPDRYGLSLAPMARPLENPPADVVDYVLEVRNFGDFYTGSPADPTAPALVGLPGGGSLSHAELAARALDRAKELGLTSADRVLISEPRRPLDWLLAPLAAGASIVLCRAADPAKLKARAAMEKVTTVLGTP